MTTKPSSPSIAIVAHTQRAQQAHKLYDHTNACYMSIDNGEYGCEQNHYRTWQWLAKHADSEWCLVLEDDAQPVEDFRNQVKYALHNAPAPIVSLYLGQLRPPHWQNDIRHAINRATTQDAHYIVGTHLLHAVAVAIRSTLIPDLLAHAPTTQHPWDYRIAAWALDNKHPVAYTFPSLVEHADEDTIAKHPDGKPREPGRKAWHTGIRTTWANTRTTPLNGIG